jgi:hypothetical protein
MDVTRKLVVIGLLLLATLITGFGKPFNLPLSKFHKLVALAWVVFTVILVYHSGRVIESSVDFIVVIAILGVSIAVLIWSGSVLTMPMLDHTIWLVLHRIATAIAVIASAIMASFFVRKSP